MASDHNMPRRGSSKSKGVPSDRLPCLSKYQDLPAVKLLVIGQWTQVICSPGRWRPLSSWSKKFLYTLISLRSISPLVSIPFPALTWHRDIRYTQQGNQTSLACAPLTLPLLINRGVSLWMSRSSRPRAYLYSMLLKSENETEWKGGSEVTEMVVVDSQYFLLLVILIVISHSGLR